MSKYFNIFPEISYLKYNAKDITTSAKLINKYINAPYTYYQMDINNDQRPEQVAEQYYDDPYYSWLVFYSNKIIDPYYDWFLPEEQFLDHIKNKYGSVEYSQKKILYFRTNWYADERELTPEQYNAQFGSYKAPYNKYWNPRFNSDTGDIVSYVRRIDDTIINTNKLMKVLVSNNTSNSVSKFSEGDLVDIKNGVNVVGTAEIAKANTSVIYMEKILGSVANSFTINLDSNNSIYCTITEQSNTYDISASSWTKKQIPDDEFVYWEPVYAFDYENELNTQKRNIQLVDSSLAFDLHDMLREELNAE